MTILALLFFMLQAQTPARQPVEPAESADAAWTILSNGLGDKSSDKRAKAAHALGLLQHNPKAQGMAEKALVDPQPDVRTQAATALGEMDARSAQEKLKEALKDPDLRVVVAAANALYTFKNPAAYDIYYALLTGERKGPGLVKSQLDTLKDKKQLEELMFEAGLGFVPFGGMGYEAWKRITHDDSSVVRAAAAEKLATDPDPETTQALGRACSDSKWRVRLAVVEAIAKRGDPQLLLSVSPLMYDGNDDVHFAAAATVIRLSGKRSSPLRSEKKRKP
jgi:HEAT repeat protein